jgi:acyl-CoA dehydrogenase
MQPHGALGISNEMPFSGMMNAAQVMAIADGPTEVHKITLATQLLKQYTAVDGLWPTGHLPTLRDAARQKYGEIIEHVVGNE